MFTVHASIKYLDTSCSVKSPSFPLYSNCKKKVLLNYFTGTNSPLGLSLSTKILTPSVLGLVTPYSCNFNFLPTPLTLRSSSVTLYLERLSSHTLIELQCKKYKYILTYVMTKLNTAVSISVVMHCKHPSSNPIYSSWGWGAYEVQSL